MHLEFDMTMFGLYIYAIYLNFNYVLIPLSVFIYTCIYINISVGVK